jgi:hypothetical protein
LITHPKVYDVAVFGVEEVKAVVHLSTCGLRLCEDRIDGAATICHIKCRVLSVPDCHRRQTLGVVRIFDEPLNMPPP